VYRYQRYRYVVVDEHGRPLSEQVESPGVSPSGGDVQRGDGGGDYYHSKQRKLLKMEADEAFEIRSGVMVVLGVLGLGLWWAFWRASSWVLGLVWEWCS
jgi:hypothetical protein